MNEDLGLGLLKVARAIDIILAPDLIDALSKYFADVPTFGFQGEQFDATVSPTPLADSWNSFIKNEFGFGKFLDLGFPIGTEFVVHLVEEELLLPALATEDVIHVQAGLLHNLI